MIRSVLSLVDVQKEQQGAVAAIEWYVSAMVIVPPASSPMYFKMEATISPGSQGVRYMNFVLILSAFGQYWEFYHRSQVKVIVGVRETCGKHNDETRTR